MAFSKEETGLEGSKKFVHEHEQLALSPRVRQFGMPRNFSVEGLAISRRPGSAAQVGAPGGVASRPLSQEWTFDKVGDDDSHPFLAAHVPVITLHSITPRDAAMDSTTRTTDWNRSTLGNTRGRLL